MSDEIAATVQPDGPEVPEIPGPDPVDPVIAAALRQRDDMERVLRFIWRRARAYADGPLMYAIEHVLFCGCGNDQHLMDRTRARETLASTPVDAPPTAYGRECGCGHLLHPGRLCAAPFPGSKRYCTCG